jgi:hypothetical protein
MSKLNVGDVILVHGHPFLSDLEDGQKYRVKNMIPYHGNQTYQFAKPKGNKVVARHYTTSVDAWIREKNHPDLNRIEICESLPSKIGT